MCNMCGCGRTTKYTIDPSIHDNQIQSANEEIARLREEVYKRNRRALAWKRIAKILYSELKIMSFEIKEMTKRLKRVLG